MADFIGTTEYLDLKLDLIITNCYVLSVSVFSEISAVNKNCNDYFMCKTCYIVQTLRCKAQLKRKIYIAFLHSLLVKSKDIFIDNLKKLLTLCCNSTTTIYVISLIYVGIQIHFFNLYNSLLHIVKQYLI